MVISSIRRRLIIEKTKKLLYILDGLLFNLDGTDKQAHGNYVWVDKVGGYGFKNNGTAIELLNGFSFTGISTSLLSADSTIPVSNAINCTVEAVLYPKMTPSWVPIIAFSDWNTADLKYLGVAANFVPGIGPFIKFSTKNPNLKTYVWENNKMSTYSGFFNQPPYINKLKITTLSSNEPSCFSNRGAARIGGRIDGNRIMTFTGDVYAVRMYNRILTEAEVLHNQTIDIKKYNIPI